MSTRTLLNLSLLVIACLLALVVYLKPGLKPEEAPRAITTEITPGQASVIDVERTARDPLELRKRDGRWYLATAAGELPAAEFQVRALLRLLQTTSSQSYSAASLDLKALGLDPVQATVIIDGFRVNFGGTDALENRRYVQIDDTVYLIQDSYQHLLNADWTNFASPRLLASHGDINRLELPDVTLSRTDDGHWALSPDERTASADALQMLISNWQNTTALYVRRDSGEYSGETITIHSHGHSEPLTLQVVSHSPDLILARPEWGIQYHLTSSLEASLFTLPESESGPGDETRQ